MTSARLRESDEGSRVDRVNRECALDPLPLIPATPFASASSECLDLYRDGHFYGCISLSQAIAEALVRLLCDCNKFKPGKVFEKNLERLRTRRFITAEFERDALEIWADRDVFHHMSPSVPIDLERLSSKAKSNIERLLHLERAIFDFETANGAVTPTSPKYWTKNPDGTIPVFLRIRG
jgi:hypothetical protein